MFPAPKYLLLHPNSHVECTFRKSTEIIDFLREHGNCFADFRSKMLSGFGQSLLVVWFLVFVQNPVVAESSQSTQKSLSLTGVNLSLRVLLQGPYDSNLGLMSNALQEQGFLPIEQPYAVSPFNYSGTEQIGSVPGAMTGQDAIVDWLLLELRSTEEPYTVLAQKAVLLQRDGDVVTAQDGAVVISFPDVAAGTYRVSVRHRMHMGVMSDAYLLNTDVRVIDFSDQATLVDGNIARYSDGQFALLWGGDSNQDNRLIVSGVGNDSNPVLSSVLLAIDNGGFNSSYILEGYSVTDLNMDGKTIYVGPNNDVNFLVANVLTHQENIGFANNFIVDPALPF